MAIGKERGEFEFSITSFTAERNGIVHANIEGHAAGFDTLIGTATLKSWQGGFGGMRFVATAFGDEGSQAGTVGEGHYMRIGKEHRFRVRGIIRSDDAGLVLTDGTFDVLAHSYSGTVYEWD